MARDLRKNQDTRRKKILNKSKKIEIKHDYLHSLKAQKIEKFNMDDLVLSDEDDSADDTEDMFALDSTQKDSTTHQIYMKLMKDPKFNLTFQPKLIEEGPSRKDQAAEAEQSHNVVEEIDLQSLLKSATLKNKDFIGMRQQEL